MDDMLNNLSTYGYIVLFLYSLGGGFVALLGAGVLSFMGKMDLSLSIAIAMIANFIGDTLMFYMSRYHKREMMEYFKNTAENWHFPISCSKKTVHGSSSSKNSSTDSKLLFHWLSGSLNTIFGNSAHIMRSVRRFGRL
jgi:hypothetical protein